MKYPHARLLVFAKAPEPGQAKTRLVPLLGRQGAADFQARLLDQCLEKVTRADLCPVELWCSPSIDHPVFRDCRERFDVALHVQSRGDLGQRMAAAVSASLADAEACVLIGTDCPSLRVADLDEALGRLGTDKEAVLGPAEDGGYYLVGLRKPNPAVFVDIPWGTREVLQKTEARMHSLGIEWHRLAVRMDVDRPEDYKRLEDAARGVREALPE